MISNQMDDIYQNNSLKKTEDLIALIFRFITEQVWETHHGDLPRLRQLTVNTSESPIAECFGNLKKQKTYILMLCNGSEPYAYLPAEPPVSSENKKHRKLVWQKLCQKIPGKNTCKLRVTISPSAVVYRNRHKILECKVESSAAVTTVQWHKDGKDITEMHEMADLYLESEGSNHALVIENVNNIHRGTYGCTAKSADGQVAQSHTKLEVVGPDIDDVMTKCTEANYCRNNGTCMRQINGNVRYCICKTGFIGKRCRQVDNHVLASTEHETEDNENQTSLLTTAVIMLAVGFACFILFGLVYIQRLRNRLAKQGRPSFKHKYQPVTRGNVMNKKLRITSENSLVTNRADSAKKPPMLTFVTDMPQSHKPLMQSLSRSPTSPHAVITPEQLAAHTKRQDSFNFELRTPSPILLAHGRHNSTDSDKNSRRGRLNAKS